MPSPPVRPEGIVTPEAVLLEFEDAGLGSRSLAFVVDLIARVSVVWAVFIVLAGLGVVVDETVLVVASVATVFGALLVYPVAFETLWRGRTPGKRLLGLRVVTVEGAPVRFRHAAIRSAFGMVDFVLAAGSLAVITALATRRNQRLGDLAAGTIVIRERQAPSSTRPIEFRPAPGWEAYAAALDVSALGSPGYGLVRSFLRRVDDLDPAARRRLAESLARDVAARTGSAFPPGTDAEAFLLAVAVAHQARSAGPGGSPTSRHDPTSNPTGPPAPPPVARRVVPPPVVTVDLPPADWGHPG